MDQSQFQAYEVAGATDMNRLHQFPQDYFKEVVEGFIGDVSDALFGSAGFSSAIVAGPSIDITVAAQTFAAAGRIGSVPGTVVNAVSTAPGDTQRFYVYLDIQTTEVSESREIANPGTGVKTPTNIVTYKSAAAGVVVVQVDDGDPESPPALGVIAPGVERIGYIKVGYVDYNETGVTNVDVFNTAGVFTPPGQTAAPSIAFNDLTDVTVPAPSAGDLVQYDGADWVNVTVEDTIGDSLRHVNELRLVNSSVAYFLSETATVTSIHAVPVYGDSIALYDGTKYVLVRTGGAISLALAGLTAGVPNDVYGYLSGGTLALELQPWTSALVRGGAAALTPVDGIYVKASDNTRRFLGTFVPSSATQITMSTSRRAIWNFYNQTVQRAYLAVSGLSYLIPDTGGSFRQVNADPTYKLEVVTGFGNMNVASISAHTTLRPTTPIAGTDQASAAIGIGFDTTTVNNAQKSNIVSVGNNVINSIGFSAHTEWVGYLPNGFNTINWLEYCELTGSGTMNFFSGAAPFTPAGISLSLLM